MIETYILSIDRCVNSFGEVFPTFKTIESDFVWKYNTKTINTQMLLGLNVDDVLILQNTNTLNSEFIIYGYTVNTYREEHVDNTKYLCKFCNNQYVYRNKKIFTKNRHCTCVNLFRIKKFLNSLKLNNYTIKDIYKLFELSKNDICVSELFNLNNFSDETYVSNIHLFYTLKEIKDTQDYTFLYSLVSSLIYPYLGFGEIEVIVSEIYNRQCVDFDILDNISDNYIRFDIMNTLMQFIR